MRVKKGIFPLIFIILGLALYLINKSPRKIGEDLKVRQLFSTSSQALDEIHTNYSTLLLYSFENNIDFENEKVGKLKKLLGKCRYCNERVTIPEQEEGTIRFEIIADAVAKSEAFLFQKEKGIIKGYILSGDGTGYLIYDCESVYHELMTWITY